MFNPAPLTLSLLLTSHAVGQVPLPDTLETEQYTLETEQWPAGVVEREQLPTERVFDYEFDGVRAEQVVGWLGWVGIVAPIEIEGQLTGWLWAQRSSRGWLDFGNYRLEGQVRSPSLRLDQWLVGNAALRFGYADGYWYVGSLSGNITAVGSDTTIGHAELALRLPMVGSELVETSGSIEQVDLPELLSVLDIDVKFSSGGGRLVINANSPLADAEQISSWTATAALHLTDVGLEEADIPSADLTANASLQQGRWSIDQGVLDWIAQPLMIDGAGQLDSDYPFALSLSGEAISVSQLLADFQLFELAEQLTGHMEAEANISGDARIGIHQATASIDSSAMTYQSQILEEIGLRATYQPSHVEFNILSARVAGGRISGNSRWLNIDQLTQLPAQMQLNVIDVKLDHLTQALVPYYLGGDASGEISLQSEASEEEISWTSTGELNVSGFSVFNTTFGDTLVNWNKLLDSSELQLQLTTDERAIHAQLVAQLIDAAEHPLRHARVAGYRASGLVEAYQIEIALPEDYGMGSESIPLELTGQFDIQGTVENWLEQGSAQLDQVVMQIAGQTLRLQRAVLDVTADEYRLQRFQFFDRHGRIAGAGIIRRNQIGQHQLNLRMVNIELQRYIETFQLPWPTVQGTVSLETRLTKDATDANFQTGWNGQFNGTLGDLRFRNQDVGQVNLNATIVDNLIRARLDGNLLGGQMTLRGHMPLAMFHTGVDLTSAELAELDFETNVTGLELARLMRLLSNRHRRTQYAGVASLQISGSMTNLTDLQLRSRLTIPVLLQNSQPLVRELALNAAYSDGRLQITELSGGLAGGRIDAQGTIPLTMLLNGKSPDRDQQAGQLRFNAQRIQLHSLIRLLFPEYANQFIGVVSYRGNVSFNRRLLISGNAQVVDAVAYGLPIQRGYADLRIALNPDGSFHYLSSSHISGTAFDGELVGDVMLRGGPSYRLDTRAKVRRGKLDQLSESLGFERIIGTGRFEGDLALHSNDVASLAALTGGLQIKFKSGDAQSFPLLTEFGRYLPILRIASSNIQTGTMHAIIGQGQLRIRDLLLVGDAFWLVAEGRASLATGRIDINAVLETGQGLIQELKQNAVQSLALSAVPQLALLAELNNLISSRSLYFHIGGTTNQPTIRARAAQTLARSVLRSVRRSLLAAPFVAATATEP